MAFKAESDDPRESLSYKLRKILEYEAAEVLCTDVYIKDPGFLPLEEVVERSDLLVRRRAAPRVPRARAPDAKPVIDIWNFFGKGAVPS